MERWCLRPTRAWFTYSRSSREARSPNRLPPSSAAPFVLSCSRRTRACVSLYTLHSVTRHRRHRKQEGQVEITRKQEGQSTQTAVSSFSRERESTHAPPRPRATRGRTETFTEENKADAHRLTQSSIKSVSSTAPLSQASKTTCRSHTV